jgi:hypothetical protein
VVAKSRVAEGGWTNEKAAQLDVRLCVCVSSKNFNHEIIMHSFTWKFERFDLNGLTRFFNGFDCFQHFFHVTGNLQAAPLAAHDAFGIN